MKIYLLYFFATLAVVHCGLKKGLKVRFGVGLPSDIGKKFYIDVPQTVSEARSSGWEETARPDGPMSSLVMYCPEERTVCPLYDPDTEHAAGLQIAFDKSKISNQVLDWNTQGYVSWTTEDGSEYWTKHQFYVDESYLAQSKEDRLDSYDSDKLFQLDSIWLTGIDGKLDRISTSREDIEDSIFTIQSCIPGMGQHFFYNMSSSFECSSRTIYPWFLLTDTEGLIATGLVTTGQYQDSGEKQWFEKVNKLFSETIAPYGSECYYDYGENPGVLSLHMYYVDEPEKITCIPEIVPAIVSKASSVLDYFFN